MIVDGDLPARAVALVRGEASMGPSMIVDGDLVAFQLRLVKLDASMGPSMIVDGDKPGTLRDAFPWVGFNGAVDDRRRRRGRRLGARAGGRASMGPSMIVDGDDDELVYEIGRQQASMGPSMIVDGDSSRELLALQSDRASMGPSMIVDGDVFPATQITARFVKLQWGRR